MPVRPFLLLCCLFLTAAMPAGVRAAIVSEVRLAQHGEFVRCVIESSEPVHYRMRNASGPEGIVSLQIQNVTSFPSSPDTTGDLGFVRSSSMNYDRANKYLYIHLNTTKSVRLDELRLSNPHRLVIDLHEGDSVHIPVTLPERTVATKPVRGLGKSGGTSAAVRFTDESPFEETSSGFSSTPRSVVAETAPPAAQRKKIIVIDPGHGGRHRGGYGHVRGKKVEEAEVTLPIAFELERLLAADPRLEPRLTRKRDLYVGLRERTRLAEQFDGDVFVSIHYNAVPASASKSKARGLEFYTWSQRDSLDQAERYLQALENEEGNASDLAHANKSARRVLSKIMLDALEEQSLKSKDFAKSLESAFLRDTYFKAHYRGIKDARFKVLENYNMPSVLIEVGFISHPDEASRAVTKSFQRDVADHIYRGIVDYLEDTDPAFKSRTLARR